MSLRVLSTVFQQEVKKHCRVIFYAKCTQCSVSLNGFNKHITEKNIEHSISSVQCFLKLCISSSTAPSTLSFGLCSVSWLPVETLYSANSFSRNIALSEVCYCFFLVECLGNGTVSDVASTEVNLWRRIQNLDCSSLNKNWLKSVVGELIEMLVDISKCAGTGTNLETTALDSQPPPCLVTFVKLVCICTRMCYTFQKYWTTSGHFVLKEKQMVGTERKSFRTCVYARPSWMMQGLPGFRSENRSGRSGGLKWTTSALGNHGCCR